MKKFFGAKSEEKASTEIEAIPSSASFASFDAALQAEIEDGDSSDSGGWNDDGSEPAARASLKLNPRLLIALLVVLLLLVAVWAFTLGPLRPTMAGLLDGFNAALNPPTATATLSPTPPPPTPTHTPFPPTFTPEFSPTAAIETEAVTATPSETPTPEATPMPTSEVAGCIAADSVTLEDVGKTLCVTGIVFKTNERPNSFSIVVGSRADSFFFVSYQRTWNLQKGQCIYATGEIARLGNNPIMLIGYNPPLNFCP